MSRGNPSSLSMDLGIGEFVNDLQFNFHGDRLAACSADGQVSVFNHERSKDKWIPSETWRAHNVSVSKLSWAAPELGQIIATCSSSGDVKLWREENYMITESGAVSKGKWVNIFNVFECEKTFFHVEFFNAKNGNGMIVCSLDGIVRVYAICCNSGIIQISLDDEFRLVESFFDRKICFISCSKSPDSELIIVAGREGSNIVKLFQKSSNGQWLPVVELNESTKPILDVACSYNVLNGLHFIATGSMDGHVRVYKLIPRPGDAKGPTSGFDAEMVGDIDDHKDSVHQVAWNYTGSVLTSVGDDGRILSFMASILGKWSCFQIMDSRKE